VVIILAILGSIVAVKLTGRTEEARISATRTQIESFSSALDAYELDNGKYPTTEQGLKALVEEPTPKPPNWKGPYLRKGKFLDPWKNAYIYKAGKDAKHNKRSYDLYSPGPDGVEGTEDDITNWD
ncbi:MAG: type II secretion system protein GspG, partial [Lentisphaerae bacterium]